MKKKSFVIYSAWRSYFELLEDPVLIRELLYAVFDLAEGKEVVVTNNKVRTALNAIEPTMKEDLEAYEARCEKNKLAAQKRWNNPSDMRSHTDAMQPDGDNDYVYDNDYDSDNETGNDSDIDMTVLPSQDIPSVNDVIEASRIRGVDMSEKEAEAFITYYFYDLKGLLNGEPIRNWRNLLKSWNDHTLIDPETVMGTGHDGYIVYCGLPIDIQKRIDEEQEKFNGQLTRATVKAIAECRKAV